MKKLNADEIRESFLKFFESKEHLRLPSFSLVPVNDPTLLIINAGMAPMKPYFKGEAPPPKKRITTCQKCIRVGDIEQVGKTARHHTFFEMLGNFSFGDYYKRKAIKWAWEYIVDILEFPKEKLYVTIHSDDDEAEKLWLEETDIKKEKISRLSDNFWGPVGNTGPCGPCSEILVDQGQEFGCNNPNCAPGCDCDRYLEIWNLVFTGLNKNEDGDFEKLPNPCIDTGLGYERLVAYMQNKKSAFETDLFKSVNDKIFEICQKRLGDNPKSDIAIKITSDHIRSVLFMACDGITPSNEGRGYVMRRLIRRALRKSQEIGFSEHSLTELVKPIVDRFSSIYPQLKERIEYSKAIIKTEEENFRRTLNQGINLLNTKIENLKAKNEKTLKGEDAFSLYDTYGFPFEMTTEILLEKGYNVDKKGFKEALEEQRKRARSSTKSRLDSLENETDFSIYKSKFIGYDEFSCNAKIEAIFIKEKPTDKISQGQEGELIFSKTCFYGESGGQLGDTGTIKTKNAKGQVLNTRSTASKVNLHHVKMEEGEIKVGDLIEIKIDKERRKNIKRHHTATHLLQSALREVIGNHVGQMGSLVDETKLRFDFSHHQSLTNEEITKIEDIVNQWILDNSPVSIKKLPVEEALNSGALAFFGEKYGDTVRVISVSDVSSELCGGTHVTRTGDIGCFKIISESAIAMGTRRIEAICGLVSLKRFQEENKLLKESASLLNTDIYKVPQNIKKLIDNIKNLEKELKGVKLDLLKSSIQKFTDNAQILGDIKVISRKIDDISRKDIMNLADLIADSSKSSCVVLGTVNNGKVVLIARLSDNLVKEGHSAVPIIKALGPIIGGSGGGRPRMAQAGGRIPEKLDEALNKVYSIIKQNILA